MQKMIKKYMLIALIIFFIQACMAVFAFLVYKLDFIHFDYLTETLIIAICVFVIADLSYVWAVLAKVSNARKKNDITAIDILGEDIQEVYNFGQIGLILVDDQDNIIWTNEWFEGIQTKLVDHNIYDWKEELKPLQDDKNELVTIERENHVYEVKLIKEANLFIFKDITEYDAMDHYNKDHAPVVGIISIDDYQDVVSLMDENKVNDLTISLQHVIFDYAKRFGILIRKLRADTFSFVCTTAQYNMMLDDKFSVTEEIKKVNTEGIGTEITASIGIALGSDDYSKLNELALNSVNVCLSRGGDQVTIQPFGGKTIFVGGKTEAKAKGSSVRIRVLAKSLAAQMMAYDNIYVMGHRDMDMDALGSCLGLVCIAKHYGKKVQIVYDEHLVESKTKKAFKIQFSHEEIKDLVISPKDCLEEMTDRSLLIISDVHRPTITLAPNVVEEAEKVAVIDHHRRGEEFVNSPVFAYVDPAASSASEIVTELIKYSENKIEIPDKIATIMLAGILLDTNYYRRSTGEKTYDASVVLKDFGADNLIADSFLKEDYMEYQQKVRIMATAETPYLGVIVCTAPEEDIIDRAMLSIVAQEALGINEINACFVIGRTDAKMTGVSARSDGTINVQYLMEKMNGGGHFSAAAVQLEKSIPEVKAMLKEMLRLYLVDARSEKK